MTSRLTPLQRSLLVEFFRREQHTAPDFKRLLVSTEDESVVVDLVRDRAPQLREKLEREDGIRVDPPEEILANKLGAVLSRAEIRDLVDVRALDEAGFSIEAALHEAVQKDAGLTPATLGWVISQIRIGDDAKLPGDVSAAAMRAFIEALARRLAALGFPPAPPPAGG